ncbi:MAG TPA: helix-turn-helix transcriptional regulator [Thermoanaerobaculia bacterium]|nr:helix-turn-helix transcriptional regulator [Thermoanaerobaculia bacterium]
MSDSDLATIIAVLRVARGWNQSQLVRASGVRHNSISDYERGKKVPEHKTLSRLLAAMGWPSSAIDLTANYLFRLRARKREDRDERGGLEAPSAHLREMPEAASATPAAMRWEMEQVAAEGGRFFGKALLLAFQLLERDGAAAALAAATAEVEGQLGNHRMAGRQDPPAASAPAPQP